MHALVLILALLASAPDIHRCEDASGAVSYRDQPCPTGQAGATFRADPESDEALSERELRRWLDGLQPESARSSRPQPVGPRTSTRTPRRRAMPAIALSERPQGQRALAACSARFFQCTDGDDAHMDRCVAGIPTCGGASHGDCCHAAFIERYASLREHGLSRQAAVRFSLLGDGRE